MPAQNASKCPKVCPGQCANCPAPAHVPKFMNQQLVDDIVDAALVEKTCPKHNTYQNSPAPVQQPNKYASHEVFRSDDDVPIPLTLPIAARILKDWYRNASFEAEEALYDVKAIWTSTEGELSKKLCATNRLFMYYFLILAIYIIQLCFVIDEKLFEGLCRIVGSINDES
ncbi:hypothetical protein TKK_0016483 [Trichogramma kaykai]